MENRHTLLERNRKETPPPANNQTSSKDNPRQKGRKEGRKPEATKDGRKKTGKKEGRKLGTCHHSDMGVSQNSGYFFGGPHSKDYSILGSILGSPYFGKQPYFITLDDALQISAGYIMFPHMSFSSLEMGGA